MDLLQVEQKNVNRLQFEIKTIKTPIQSIRASNEIDFEFEQIESEQIPNKANSEV